MELQHIYRLPQPFEILTSLRKGTIKLIVPFPPLGQPSTVEDDLKKFSTSLITISPVRMLRVEQG